MLGLIESNNNHFRQVVMIMGRIENEFGIIIALHIFN